MTVRDLIEQLQRFAAQDLKGGDMEVVLFDRFGDREMRIDADNDRFDFEVTRGDGQVVVEFD